MTTYEITSIVLGALALVLNIFIGGIMTVYFQRSHEKQQISSALHQGRMEAYLEIIPQAHNLRIEITKLIAKTYKGLTEEEVNHLNVIQDAYDELVSKYRFLLPESLDKLMIEISNTLLDLTLKLKGEEDSKETRRLIKKTISSLDVKTLFLEEQITKLLYESKILPKEDL